MNILSLSYGKDSLACFGACEQLGIKIDRVVHAEVWATDAIPADLPPMVEFKKKADKIIKDRWGLEVEHICSLKTQGWAVANKPMNQCSITNLKKENISEQSKDFHKQSEVGAKNSSLRTTVLTYENMFYRKSQGKIHKNEIYGFPIMGATWCVNMLKTDVLDKFFRSQIVQVERERERAGFRNRADSRHST